jgi:hypothetical protein
VLVATGPSRRLADIIFLSLSAPAAGAARCRTHRAQLTGRERAASGNASARPHPSSCAPSGRRTRRWRCCGLNRRAKGSNAAMRREPSEWLELNEARLKEEARRAEHRVVRGAPPNGALAPRNRSRGVRVLVDAWPSLRPAIFVAGRFFSDSTPPSNIPLEYFGQALAGVLLLLFASPRFAASSLYSGPIHPPPWCAFCAPLPSRVPSRVPSRAPARAATCMRLLCCSSGLIGLAAAKLACVQIVCAPACDRCLGERREEPVNASRNSARPHSESLARP